MKKSARVRGCRAGLEEDSGRLHRSGERGEEEEREGALSFYHLSLPRLDSVKLWNNPLMSPPCRVDRMPTKLWIFLSFALSLPLSLCLSFSRCSSRFLSFSHRVPTPPFIFLVWASSCTSLLLFFLSLFLSLSFSLSTRKLDRCYDLDYCKTGVALWLCFKRIAWLIPSV